MGSVSRQLPGSRVVGDAVARGHFHLPLPTFPRCRGGFGRPFLIFPARSPEGACAEGPKIRSDSRHSLPPHKGTASWDMGLGRYFPGENEIGLLPLHPASRDGQHQGMAIDAGVQVFSVTVAGRTEHPQMFFGDVDDVQRKADPPCGCPGLFGREERGRKGDPQDLDPLLLDHLEGQHAVQPP